jgi:hypothetical protein
MTDHPSSGFPPSSGISPGSGFIPGANAFDVQLQRLFAQTPPTSDAAEFADRLQRRLNRRWALRRVLITLAGVSGAMITLWQVMSAHLIARADVASQAPAAEARHAFTVALLRLHMATNLVQALPFGGEILWLIAGLAVMAAALLATRLFETL